MAEPTSTGSPTGSPGVPLSGRWLTTAVAYPEGSIRRVAFRAEQRGLLERYITVGRPQWRIDPRLLRLAVGAERAARIRTRLPERTTYTATASEVHRLATKLSGSPLRQRDAMYRAAHSFDDSVGRLLRRLPPGAHIGMPGASLAAFRAVRQRGGVAGFHAVNAHPAVQNEILLAHHSAAAVANELLPPQTADRIQAELELADVVVVPSRFVQEQMVAHGVPAGRTALLPFGVDLASFQPSRRARRAGPVRVLAVGQISRRKGVDVLVEAARRQGVEVTLVGPVVSDDLLTDLPEGVRHVGQLTPAQVVAEMQQHDAFVLPSLEDACALVTVEAAATGLPVITTRANGGHELLGDDPALTLVTPGDPASLAEALGAVSPLAAERREELAVARRQHALASWDEYADGFIAALQQAQAAGTSRG